MANTVIITGSGGLIGGETVRFFAEKGFTCVGIDNDMRRYFFGEDASTAGNRKEIERPRQEHFSSLDFDACVIAYPSPLSLFSHSLFISFLSCCAQRKEKGEHHRSTVAPALARSLTLQDSFLSSRSESEEGLRYTERSS